MIFVCQIQEFMCNFTSQAFALPPIILTQLATTGLETPQVELPFTLSVWVRQKPKESYLMSMAWVALEEKEIFTPFSPPPCLSCCLNLPQAQTRVMMESLFLITLQLKSPNAPLVVTRRSFLTRIPPEFSIWALFFSVIVWIYLGGEVKSLWLAAPPVLTSPHGRVQITTLWLSFFFTEAFWKWSSNMTNL